jgi:hypothetical protein
MITYIHYFNTKKEAKIYIQKRLKEIEKLSLIALKDLQKGCDLSIEEKIYLSKRSENA